MIARAAHVGTPQAVVELFDWMEKELGAPDIAVNNAATNPHFGPLLTAEWGAWDKTFEVNVKGYFEVARQTAKRLVAAGKAGSIVNVASMVGLRGSPMQGNKMRVYIGSSLPLGAGHGGYNRPLMRRVR